MRLSPFAPETDSAFKKSKKKNAYDLCKTVSIFPIIYKKKKEKYFNEYARYFTAVKILFRTIKKSYSILNVCSSR